MSAQRRMNRGKPCQQADDRPEPDEDEACARRATCVAPLFSSQELVPVVFPLFPVVRGPARNRGAPGDISWGCSFSDPLRCLQIFRGAAEQFALLLQYRVHLLRNSGLFFCF